MRSRSSPPLVPMVHHLGRRLLGRTLFWPWSVHLDTLEGRFHADAEGSEEIDISYTMVRSLGYRNSHRYSKPVSPTARTLSETCSSGSLRGVKRQGDSGTGRESRRKHLASP